MSIYVPADRVTFKPWCSELQAYRDFAEKVHGDQKRKYKGTPYIEHLDHVAEILSRYDQRSPNNELNMKICYRLAYLHDTMEDAEVQLLQIEQLATADTMLNRTEVFHLLGDILTLTKPSGAFVNRNNKLATYDRQLNVGSIEAQTVKVADIMSNCGDIVELDPKFARTYLREKAHCLQHLDKVDWKLKQEAFEVIFASYDRLVEIVGKK